MRLTAVSGRSAQGKATFKAAIATALALLVAACAPAAPSPTAAPPAPTAVPPKPAATSAPAREEAKPAPKPTEATVAKPAAVASPASKPAEQPAAKPADPQDTFFAGKTMRIVVGFSAGGGFDLQARLLGRHLGKHLPGNPNVVVENKAGAGSLLAANDLYNVAPKDGTQLAVFNEKATVLQLVGAKGVAFDVTKYAWLGSPESANLACVARSAAGFKTFQDLIGSSKPLIIGAISPADGTYQYPTLLNAVAGTNFKTVEGYQGSDNIELALEKGEVDGVCTTWTSLARKHPEWFSSGQVVVLGQYGLTKHPDLPNIPMADEFIKTEDGKQMWRALVAPSAISRPIVGPPGLPAERVTLLRRGVEQTYKDAAFLAEGKTAGLDMAPKNGEEVERIVMEIMKTPPEVARKLGQTIPF